MKIRTKLTLAGIGLTIVPLAAVAVFALLQLSTSERVAREEVLELANETNERTVAGVLATVTSQQEVLEQLVEHDLDVAQYVLGQTGQIGLLEATARWTVTNQFTGGSESMDLPQMAIDGEWLGQNASLDVRTPYVDYAADLLGSTITVFQRMNADGDMLRVATNVEKLDGSRAIGTYIPAMNTNGSANSVVSTVLSGERFVGRAFVVNKYYVTAYEPILDSDGAIIGMLYAGVPEESARSLRREVMEMRVGETGYVFVLDSQGRYVISRGGTRDGEVVMNAQDSDGRLFVRDLVTDAIDLPDGSFGSISYPWQNEGDPVPRMKTVSYAYFAPWDWVVAAGTYDEEFLQGVNALAEANARGELIIYLAIGASAILAVIIWLILSGRIAGPIVRAVAFARRISRGELGIDLDINQSDEIGTLADALRDMLDSLQYKARCLESVANGDLTIDVDLASEDDGLGKSLVRMVDGLNEILYQVQTASDQVGAGAEQIAGSSQSLSTGATESASSLEEISASMNEIAGQTRQANTNVIEAQKLSGQAALDAKSGQGTMVELEEAMQSISESSATTRKIVKVIDDIAFQINLLALNANVEAARAGKYGKGFAVVADEVRNLAARSAEAVKETTAIVDESVAAIDRGGTLTASTASQFEAIVVGATKVADVLEEVVAASNEQQLGIEQIEQGLTRVDQVTQSNTAEAEESAAASEQLSGQAGELANIVRTFKLSRNANGHSEIGEAERESVHQRLIG